MKPSIPSDPERSWLTLKSGKIAYTDVGTGPVVLGIHGCPGSVRDWRWLGSPLESFARFLRFDLPGFGYTPLSVDPDPTMAGRVRVLIESLDVLGIERCIPIAHSAGGLMALELAARYPERVEALALIAVPGARAHRAIRKYPYAKWMSRGLRVPVVRGPLTRLVRTGFSKIGFPAGLPTHTVRHTMHIAANMDFERQRENISRITQPTLVAWSEDDAFVEGAIGKELGDALPDGPRLYFKSGGHYIQKTQAVEIADAMHGWIQTRA